MTKHPDLFASLAAPFEPNEVKVRSTAGRQLHYITARTAMNRLDNVLGPENWWDEYAPHENSVLCRLTILLPDGTTLTKSDAGGYAGMSDQGDDDKSGYSDAFKRAAVKLGIGRHLYNDGIPRFVEKALGIQAHPARRPAEPPRQDHAPSNPPQSRNFDDAPRSGRALFAWAKKQEEGGELDVIKGINAIGQKMQLPAR